MLVSASCQGGEFGSDVLAGFQEMLSNTGRRAHEDERSSPCKSHTSMVMGWPQEAGSDGRQFFVLAWGRVWGLASGMLRLAAGGWRDYGLLR